MKSFSYSILVLIAIFTLTACERQADGLPIVLETPVVMVPTPNEDDTETKASTRIRSTAVASANNTLPSPMVTATPSPTVRALAVDTTSPMPRPQSSPTRPARPSATTVPTRSATMTATPEPSATALFATPAIHHFELASVEELDGGKRVTFSWSGEGDHARILADTRQRFLPWWEVPVSGTLTVDLQQTLISNPVVTLTVSTGNPMVPAQSFSTTESITIPWACPYDYFFSTAPQQCARDVPTNLLIAEQSFEGGRMVWLSSERKILVLYDEVQPFSLYPPFERFDDTWVEGEPESDPDIVPPEGFYQPVRGFGKVWRNNPRVRERLGWALALETSSSTQWQFMHTQVIGSISFLRLLDGNVIQLRGYEMDVGSWFYYEPETS